MGHADTYEHGTNNGLCMRCGFKFKFSELRRTWDNLWVCSKDWEPRQPQDFVRGVPDNQSVPAASPEGADEFVADITPDALVFTDVTIAPSTLAVSNSVTLRGLLGSVAISVSGGEYTIDGGSTWATAAGTVINGDVVRVRHTSASATGTATNTTLTVGDTSDTFTSTTSFVGSVYDGGDEATRDSADLIGIANGKKGTFSAWVRIDGGNGTQRFLYASPANQFFVRLFSDNKFQISGIGALDLKSTSAYTAGSTWLHLLASWDVATAGARHLYVSDASDLTVNTFSNNTIQYTGDGGAYLCHVGSTNRWTGAVGEYFFDPTRYIDLSIQANRRKFISSAIGPVSLGSDGSAPLGGQPILFVPNGNPAANAGSGGVFSVTGSLGTAFIS